MESPSDTGNMVHESKMREAFEAWWHSVPMNANLVRIGVLSGPTQKERAAWQEATRQAMERECKWTREDDFDSYVWHTACGHAFLFSEDGPEENGAKFCCYCGGKLRALTHESEKRNG